MLEMQRKIDVVKNCIIWKLENGFALSESES